MTVATKKAKTTALEAKPVPQTAFSMRLMREYTVPGAFYNTDAVLRTPESVFEFLKPFAAAEMTEVLWVLPLDVDGHLLTDGPVAISKGTLDSVSASPRDVFRVLLNTGAYLGVMVHNHPGTTPETLRPSKEDVEVSAMMVKLGWLHGIEIIDCMVINHGGFTSLARRGLLPPRPIKDIISAIIGG